MKALSLLLLSSFFTTAFAADIGYEVEIILFEDTTGVYNHVENWGMMEQSTTPENVTGESTPAPAANKPAGKSAPQYQFLKPSQFRLNSQAEKLAKHPDYRVLIHTAWKQPGLDRDQAFPVHVDSYTQQSDNATQTQATGKSTSRVSGDITLVMSRYLHINTNLVYEKPGQQSSLSYSNLDASSGESRTTDTYPLVFERRMRSREIHYLDHPLVGMIVLTTPFKIGSESDQTKPAQTYKTL